ncbi:hypothetical protein VCR31J2_1270109 [Vibrio coralliirubri]|uniref:Uncharacterized protein n=1 Tax=Vibrio coralliirubri TaxID=1516159 RepID=A0AA86WRE6_9VIBR|nr:hypothetical protein VCR31J2_1270109 [Vibrio coralliirubri]
MVLLKTENPSLRALFERRVNIKADTIYLTIKRKRALKIRALFCIRNQIDRLSECESSEN